MPGIQRDLSLYLRQVDKEIHIGNNHLCGHQMGQVFLALLLYHLDTLIFKVLKIVRRVKGPYDLKFPRIMLHQIF